MNLEELTKKISKRTAKLAVIGLGYVGLPLAATLADTGFDVLGIDVKPDRVEIINQGKNPIGGIEPGLDELLSRNVLSTKLRATTDYSELTNRDIIFINVETPVGEDHKPDYHALLSVIHSLGPVLQKGALVIIESTISPGTMENLVLPELEKSSGGKINYDFYLGNCPERVMPGKLLINIRSMGRVIGGANEETAQTMAALYTLFVKADLDLTDWVTAELVKTVENTYRDVQIAFANEIAMLCEMVGADVWRVRELVNKTPQRNVHKPGAGVGGHCIPKDPWLLDSSVNEKGLLKLIPTARSINDGMPAHVFNLLQKGLQKLESTFNNVRVLILGYAYLENSDDERNSPSAVLERILDQNGISTTIQDPYILAYQGDVYEKAAGCDAVIIMTAHTEYFSLDLGRLKDTMRSLLIIDGRCVIDKEKDLQGFLLLQVGRG